MSPIWVVARKELIDNWRDRRSLASALMYTLMGPAVVFLVSLRGAMPGEKLAAVLAGILSVFVMVAAFVGGMHISIDLVAGERERHSLMPLVLTSISSNRLVLGKWLAVCLFSAASLSLNILASAAVVAHAGFLGRPPGFGQLVMIAVAVVSLVAFASSLQLLLSTTCRTVKEAQTHLSLAMFVPMGLGFLGVFVADAKSWGPSVPLLGHQMLLETVMQGGSQEVVSALVREGATLGLAGLGLVAAIYSLRRYSVYS